MSNKWLFIIDNNSSFNFISVNNIFEFNETHGQSIDFSMLQKDDEILIFRKHPIDAMQLRLLVWDVEDGVKFKKTHELEGLSKDKIIKKFTRLEESLEEEYIFIKLEDNEYDELYREFLLESVLQLNNVDSVSSTNEKVPYAHNRIIFGAPGTGKSFMVEEQREKYFVNRYRRVTFYPNYSYGQFFGTYKPTKEILPSGDSKITYEFVPGPFMHTLLDALESKQNGTDENYLLIVEEINRANAPAVFGEVFQLLDRDAHGKSEYPITLSEDAANYIAEKHPTITIVNNEIRLPNNMYIWSTMNSADQGVQPLDSAFKRRFDFEYISINQGEDEIQGIEVMIPGVATKVKWNLFRKTLNEFLVREYTHLKEDKLIGPFFIKKNVLVDENAFENAFTNKLLMYLFEDVLKTANKDKLFTKRTFSDVVDVSGYENVADRKVFTDLFYASLLEKVATESNAQSAPQASADSNEAQTIVEHYED